MEGPSAGPLPLHPAESEGRRINIVYTYNNTKNFLSISHFPGKNYFRTSKTKKKREGERDRMWKIMEDENNRNVSDGN